MSVAEMLSYVKKEKKKYNKIMCNFLPFVHMTFDPAQRCLRVSVNLSSQQCSVSSVRPPPSYFSMFVYKKMYKTLNVTEF